MVPCNLPSDYLRSLPLGIIFVMCICALFLSLVLDIRLPEAGTVSLIILSIVIHEYSLIVRKNTLSDPEFTFIVPSSFFSLVVQYTLDLWTVAFLPFLILLQDFMQHTI